MYLNSACFFFGLALLILRQVVGDVLQDALLGDLGEERLVFVEDAEAARERVRVAGVARIGGQAAVCHVADVGLLEDALYHLPRSACMHAS